MNAIDALSRTILLCRDYVADELSDSEIALAFQSTRVLCSADVADLSTHSGQTALVTLVSLLSRMGIEVGLAVPDVDLVRPQPPFAPGGIRTSLVAASEKMIPGAVVQSADANFSPNLQFTLSPVNRSHDVVPIWRISASEWLGAIHPTTALAGRTWSRDSPIGPMVGALLAASEAFKWVMRKLRLRNEGDAIYFEPSTECIWDFGWVELSKDILELGPVDFISGGAISQAALYAFTRVPRLSIQPRIFDDDVTGISNLNRNMLTLIEDVGVQKVDVIASRCAHQFNVESRKVRFGSECGPDRLLSSRVAVGVDHIPSRWAVQRSAPGWVGVSGTSHFSVSSSSHDVGQACSGCLHPVDDPDDVNPMPTISFVSMWGGLALAVRIIREALHTPYPLNRQHLWFTPLRLDQPHAAFWSPVPAIKECPVACPVSRGWCCRAEPNHSGQIR